MREIHAASVHLSHAAKRALEMRYKLAILGFVAALMVTGYLNLRPRGCIAHFTRDDGIPQWRMAGQLPPDVIRGTVRGWPYDAWQAWEGKTRKRADWNQNVLAFDAGFGVGLLLTCAVFGYFAPRLIEVLQTVIRRAIRRRREQLNRCGACGYNLYGNASGTCPECGSRVTIRSPSFFEPGSNL